MMTDTNTNPLIDDMRSLAARRGQDAGQLRSPFGAFRGFKQEVKRMMVDYAAEFGPHLWVDTTRTDWRLNEVVHVVLDCEGNTIFDELNPWAHINKWTDSPVYEAAFAYKREAGWDFAPDDSGIWILAYIPRERWDAHGGATLIGNLVGFAVLQDRDEDGEIESLTHLWTARSVRRIGVATKLLEVARARFPLTSAEDPNPSGQQLLAKCWPDAVHT